MEDARGKLRFKFQDINFPQDARLGSGGCDFVATLGSRWRLSRRRRMSPPPADGYHSAIDLSAEKKLLCATRLSDILGTDNYCKNNCEFIRNDLSTGVERAARLGNVSIGRSPLVKFYRRIPRETYSTAAGLNSILTLVFTCHSSSGSLEEMQVLHAFLLSTALSLAKNSSANVFRKPVSSFVMVSIFPSIDFNWLWHSDR